MTHDSTMPLVERAPFIPYAEIATAPEALHIMLEKYSARMGFLPNALRFYLHRPEIADLLWRLNDAIMRDATSTLDQGLKRKLGALASKTNGCKYCTTHHCELLASPGGFGAEGWDMSDQEMTALLGGHPEAANEFEQVCFDFVRLASYEATDMPDEIFERLKRLLTPAQIVELASVAGFWKMYNTIHDSLRIPIEQHLLTRSQTVGIE
jgi:alkylhydroperoxidase family enzyme